MSIKIKLRILERVPVDLHILPILRPMIFILKRLPFLVVAIFATWYWWPSLWGGKILLHGDSAHLFLPLLYLQHAALHGEGSLLWADYFFGGHPIFAEGQGGFANPLNIICAYFFDPAYGIGVLRWLSMMVAGVGVYRLCRYQGSTRWAAVAACLIVLFSSAWVGAYHNSAMSVTLAWVPWFLYATDRWFKRPCITSSGALACAVALLATAGYPQIAHGALLYAFIALVTRFAFQSGRVHIACNFKRLAITGIMAIVLALCLSAIQILPLVELSKLSSRADGVELVFAGLIPAKSYLLGLFQGQQGLTASLGNPLAALIIISLLLVRISPYAIGQVLAAAALFMLGMEYASPFFRLFYDGGLLPGLRNYRMMHPFFAVFVVGVGVVVAYILTALARSEFSSVLTGLFGRACAGYRVKFWSKFIFIISSGGGLYHLVGMKLLAVVPAFLIVLLVLVALNGACRQLFPGLMALSIMLFIIFREDSPVFEFYSPDNLRAPKFISEYADQAELFGYRTYTRSASGGFVFLDSADPSLQVSFRRDMEAFSPMAGIMWGIQSISGTLALPMKRWRYTFDQINKEISGLSGAVSAPRLLDILSVRFIAFDSKPDNLRLKYYYQENEHAPFIYLNEFAKPRFQIYPHALSVQTAEAAVSAIDSGYGHCLIVEREATTNSPPLQPESKCPEFIDIESNVEVVSSVSGKHVVNVLINKPAWLFISEANYPGWTAKVNGKSVEIYSAQVLGKAIELQTGDNHVEVVFSPRSVYLGSIISALGLLLLVAACIIERFFIERELSNNKAPHAGLTNVSE